jgi:hypothetical protein
MLRRYALDPSVPATSVQTCQQITALFGFEQGRLISRFPTDWWQHFLKAVDGHNGFRDVERKRIKLSMERCLKTSAIADAATYDRGSDWIRNAEREHGRRPFAAVLSGQKRELANWIVVPDELDIDLDCLKFRTQSLVPRTPAALAEAVAPLLVCSKEVRFVDPYFDPYATRFQSTLKAFLRVLSDARHQPSCLEYHLLESNRMDNKGFIRGCEANISRLVLPGQVIKFFRWREKTNRQDIHARFILTERSGFNIERGLDEGPAEQLTPVILLNDDVRKNVWSWYSGASDVFELREEPICISQHGLVEEE